MDDITEPAIPHSPVTSFADPSTGPDRPAQRPDSDARSALPFEQLISDLIASFVSVGSRDLDGAIRHALRQIGEALDLDRVSLFEFREQDMLLAHNWSRSDLLPEPGDTYGPPGEGAIESASSRFPWSVAAILAGRTVGYASPDEIPDPVERETVRRMGSESGIAFPLSVDGQIQGCLSFACVRHRREWPDDITRRLRTIAHVFANALARKRADSAIHASEDRFRAVADNAPALIWVGAIDKSCIWLNRRWLDFVGRPMDCETGNGWTANLHPDDAGRCLAIYEAAFDARQPFSMEYRLRRRDGVFRWMLAHGSPNYTRDGEFDGYVGSCIDVTEAKESNIRLELLHRITRSIGGREDLASMYRQVMRVMTEKFGFDFGCICTFDAARYVLTIADLHGDDTITLRLGQQVGDEIAVEGEALTGAVAGEMVYEPVLSCSTPPCRALFDAGITSLVATPLRVENDIFGVLVVARREADAFSPGDREFLQRLSEHVGLAARQAELYAALQRAYGDLRQTQQAAAEQERLRVIGQMASGIAHDINNGISPVSLFTETILESEPGLSPDSREYLQTIQRAVEDVTQTLGRLNDFSRRREPSLALNPVDLNATVEQVKTLTRARWRDMPLLAGKVILMHTDLDEHLPRVLGVEGELREALTNLVLNAVDAMPAGGVITINTRLVPANSGIPADPLMVELEVTDTGVGMDEATRSRCLEPFFTTKGARGTGLGLATVYGVVQRHSARMEIESRVGVGTTIRIALPPARVDAPAARNLSIPASSRPLRILAIDDDPVVIRSLQHVLERDGHSVTTASGGSQGIDAARAAVLRGEPYDVVLTDFAMPHVDGYKVAAAVKRCWAATLVLLLTGWDRRQPSQELPPNVDEVLNKPPRLGELRAALVRAGNPESTV
jgi:PAS domain S-box-containing protein